MTNFLALTTQCKKPPQKSTMLGAFRGHVDTWVVDVSDDCRYQHEIKRLWIIYRFEGFTVRDRWLSLGHTSFPSHYLLIPSSTLLTHTTQRSVSLCPNCLLTTLSGNICPTPAHLSSFELTFRVSSQSLHIIILHLVSSNWGVMIC